MSTARNWCQVPDSTIQLHALVLTVWIQTIAKFMDINSLKPLYVGEEFLPNVCVIQTNWQQMSHAVRYTYTLKTLQIFTFHSAPVIRQYNKVIYIEIQRRGVLWWGTYIIVANRPVAKRWFCKQRQLLGNAQDKSTQQ
jgi:hypothetical protein